MLERYIFPFCFLVCCEIMNITAQLKRLLVIFLLLNCQDMRGFIRFSGHSFFSSVNHIIGISLQILAFHSRV